ncbi:30432_t:CDS:1, partial [Gigaspora margarita]
NAAMKAVFIKEKYSPYSSYSGRYNQSYNEGYSDSIKKKLVKKATQTLMISN